MVVGIKALRLCAVLLLVFRAGCSGQNLENKFRVPYSNLYELLLNIADQGLQARRIQDDLETNFDWQYQEPEGEQLLKQRLNAVSHILEDNVASVWELRETILDNFDDFLVDPAPLVPREQNCCYSSKQNDSLGTCVTTANKDETGLAVNAGPEILTEMMYDDMGYTTQYFALKDGSMIMTLGFNHNFTICETYDPRRRYWYVESESPYPRDVVLLVDQTSSMTHPELLTATINRIIDCMTSSDRIVAVPSRDIAEYGRFRGNWWASDMRAGLGVWMDGHEFLKDRLRQLIKSEVATTTYRFDSHVDALHWAEDLLYAKPIYPLNVKREPVDIVVLVTGRAGWASWEGNNELADNVNLLVNSNVTLIVFTLPGADEDYEEGSPHATSEAGIHINPIVNKGHLNRANLARYFMNNESIRVNTFEGPDLEESDISMPYFDAFGASLVISICLPINVNGSFWGSACNDISVVNLFEKLMTVPDIQDAYAFAMDNYGRAMMHPLFPSPTKLSDHPLFIQIQKLEQHDEVFPILQKMVDGQSGSKVVRSQMIRNVGRPFQIELPNAISSSKARLHYFWGSVKGAKMSIAVVLPQAAVAVTYKCKTKDLCEAPHFQYHRWDVDATKPETCRFFGMEAVRDNALVKLAPSCFKDVLGYMFNENNETVDDLYDIFKFNQAKSDLLVGDELREGVALGERAEEYWRSTDNISQFLGARYMGTSEGVFVVYPGRQLETQSYDPRLRPWYLRAVDSVATEPVVTVSPPYCDSFGAGLIVTVSTALKSPEPHRHAVAVTAGDFTSQYMNDNFVQQLPECEGKFICFLIDNSGYVIMHTKWQNDPPQHPTKCEVPLHGAHINEVEPVISMKLVEMNILKRKGCFDYADLSLFIYWGIELPRHQNQVLAEDFAMNHIPYSNLYLIVYESLDRKRGCSCRKAQSSVPGQPQWCRNTCENRCECPCLAAPTTIKCSNHREDLLREQLPACWPRNKVSEGHPTSFAERLKSLEPCKTSNCTAPDRRSCSKTSMTCFWYQDGCHDVNTL